MSSSGSIPYGAISYLKGAARIQTAIAAVLACHQLGRKACLGLNC